jgi:hypothetical protein
MSQSRHQATVKEKREILQQLVKDDEGVRQSIKDYDGGFNSAVQNMSVEKIDLNHDGQLEFMVEGVLGTMLCGASNCPSWVYRKAGNTYKLLLSDSGSGISLERSSTNGYRDLRVSGHYSASETYVTIHKFDGNKYRAKDCSIHEYVGKQVQITRRKCAE